MKKLTILLVLFMLSLAFITESKGQTLPKMQSALIKNRVDSVFSAMVVFAEKLDFDALSAGVNDRHGAGFIINDTYYSDYASLIEAMKQNARGISRQDISVKEKKITVLSDRTALLTASGVAVARLDDGREITANFKWSFVYEKIDNNWKVIYSHQSTAR